ncbi:glucokinase [Desulforhopalus singaporensis]|uniref:Glucokinase n=2 Tax=Desulforhopalus singaporensis TaxID=91360 RepID=A0A1H0QBV7_9BACT|nr:glucokinase [Desulforhopalus singaporensis]
MVGDIGGSKSEFAIFSSDDPATPLDFRRYANSGFNSAEEVMEKYLSQCSHSPQTACLAVAGVVEAERAQMTNLDWHFDACALAARFSFAKVVLINDMTALASSLPLLDRNHQLMTLNSGSGKQGAVCGLVAPGTGLGEGLFVRLGQNSFFALGSEGGHGGFSPADKEQLELLQWLQQKVSPVSWEMVASGRGIPALFAYYTQHCGMAPSGRITRELAGGDDQTRIIIDGGVTGDRCPVCARVVELFLAIVGSEAGNLALKLNATGGIYLGGGILPRLVGRTSFAPLVTAFGAKGKMTELVARIPLYLILEKKAVLMGGANFVTGGQRG